MVLVEKGYPYNSHRATNSSWYTVEYTETCGNLESLLCTPLFFITNGDGL